MINNEITSWTQPVGSEIKGDQNGDSERKVNKAVLIRVWLW
jgi:hypothetical protein